MLKNPISCDFVIYFRSELNFHACCHLITSVDIIALEVTVIIYDLPTERSARNNWLLKKVAVIAADDMAMRVELGELILLRGRVTHSPARPNNSLTYPFIV